MFYRESSATALLLNTHTYILINNTCFEAKFKVYVKIKFTENIIKRNNLLWLAQSIIKFTCAVLLTYG